MLQMMWKCMQWKRMRQGGWQTAGEAQRLRPAETSWSPQVSVNEFLNKYSNSTKKTLLFFAGIEQVCRPATAETQLSCTAAMLSISHAAMYLALAAFMTQLKLVGLVAVEINVHPWSCCAKTGSASQLKEQLAGCKL